MQSSSQIVTANKPTPNFLQAGCPSCRPTNSVTALKGISTHTYLHQPKTDLVMQTIILNSRSGILSTIHIHRSLPTVNQFTLSHKHPVQNFTKHHTIITVSATSHTRGSDYQLNETFTQIVSSKSVHNFLYFLNSHELGEIYDFLELHHSQT